MIGYLQSIYGLLWGVVAYDFGLLDFPGKETAVRAPHSADFDMVRSKGARVR